VSASRPRWAQPALLAALLVLAAVAVYAGNATHDFFLDDAHAIVDNLALRSLANIPAFFTDAGLFSTLRANVDYRPVLLTTFAANYAMGGLATPWWHATQVLLHLVVAGALWALGAQVLRRSELVREGDPALTLVPAAAALLFVVHPTGSGVVNYMSARSSLLTAAFVLPSIVLYLRTAGRGGATSWAAALFFALGLLTKVEAIAALGVYALAELWATACARTQPASPIRDAIDTLRPDVLRRLAPFLVIAAAYFAWRAQVMAPFAFDETRRSADVSALDYLRTQTVVWWLYLRQWFLPLGLVADHGSYPVYRSWLDAPVLAAVAGWAVVAALLWRSWARAPWLAFVVVSALALVSPTSSIAPLAEMLNEHRPYLPRAVLSLAWVLPVGVWLQRHAGRGARRAAVLATPVALTLLLGAMTVDRNHAFSTSRAYLEDINAKAPSHRSLMNYGLILMGEGRYPEALSYFERARALAPAWPFVHINLGIVHRALGDPRLAEEHFSLAVRYDTQSGIALRWRGEHYLTQRRWADALADFTQAQGVSLERYDLAKGIATANAGLGRSDAALAATRECLRLDEARTGTDITSIAAPFFDDLALTAAGLAYFEGLERDLPDAWWVPANIATLATRLGDQAKAQAAAARSARLKG
jgi:protein O-mannosyl-transferase